MKPETALQINIVSMLSIYSARYGFVFFAVPNEGFLQGWFSGGGKWTDKLNRLLTTLKKMGLTPGVSDLVIMSDGKGYAMEVKDLAGRQTDNQVRFENWCQRNHVPYRVVRSVDDALACLTEWGIV